MKMIKMISAAILLLMSTSVFADADSDVRAVIAQVSDGYSRFDARMVADMYTDGAIWQNPFGVRLHGKKEIQEFLTKLFSRATYRQSDSDNNFKITDVKFRSPDIAVVWSEESGVSKEKDQSDKVIGVRKSHYMEVLIHTSDGWRIVDDMIMDEK